MDWTTLQLAVERVLESRFVDKTLSIVWHAGEPLVMPVDWYEEAFERIDTLNSGRTAITHNIQTNAVLMDDRWIDLFRRHTVRVGVSLDGPARLHDVHRKTRSGSSTHRRVMDAIELLNASGLEYHVICVLTSTTMEAADEMHAFFRDNGIRMIGFNVEEIEGANTHSTMSNLTMTEGYRRFLRRMLELSRVHDTPYIRELQAARAVILDRDYQPWNNQEIVPLRILSVAVNGDIGTFSPELLGNGNKAYGNFVFGNVKRNRLDDLLTDKNFTTVRKEIVAGVRACRDSCPYFMTCGGGAPANKVFETGRFDVTETMFCRLTRQIPIEVVLAGLEADFGLASPPPRTSEPKRPEM